jgi:AcrR family transcriptional regulator
MQISLALEGRRERRKRELRGRIYQAARQLFRAHGFEATTVEQIAEAADVAPATLFNHYPSKRALLHEMTGEVLERLELIAQEELAAAGRVATRLAGFADRCARELGEWRDLAHDVLLELAQSSARPGEPIPHIWRLAAPFAARIEVGRRGGEVRGDIDPAFAAELFVGALTVLVTRWLSDPAFPIEQRMRQTAVLIGEAIGAAAPPPRAKARRTRA